MSFSQSDSLETKRLLECAAGGDRRAHSIGCFSCTGSRCGGSFRCGWTAGCGNDWTRPTSCRRHNSSLTADFNDFLKRRPMPFRLWLRKTAQQQVCDAQRTHLDRRRRSVLREEAGLSRSSRLIVRGLLSAQSSPSETLARREQVRRIAGAVAELATLTARSLSCGMWKALTFEEIAPVLDMQPAAVRQRYGRALIKLRDEVEGYWSATSVGGESLRRFPPEIRRQSSRHDTADLLAKVADEFSAAAHRGERPGRRGLRQSLSGNRGHLARRAAGADADEPVALAIGAHSPSSSGRGPWTGEENAGCWATFASSAKSAAAAWAWSTRPSRFRSGRTVALKVLPFAAMLDQRQLTRFRNEARAAARCTTTTSCPVFSVGCERGVHYYAMQYIEGESLARD